MSGDAELLGQAFLNLMLNALQSMPDGGTLRIGIDRERAAALEGPSVTITFADMGCGMSQEVMSRMFEPFFTTREKGTGLGLSVAARIVEGHGGRIEVTSEQGVGSTFELHLPCGTRRVCGAIGGNDGR